MGPRYRPADGYIVDGTFQPKWNQFLVAGDTGSKQSVAYINNLHFRQYETENAKRKAENRASEVNNVISAPGSSKVAWEQLGSFINFNASRGAHETDKSRMKSLLFKLKQEPPKVPTH